MKRAEATVTHLESEVVSCPFCVEPDFGVIYEMKKVGRSSASVLTPGDRTETDPCIPWKSGKRDWN